MYLVLLLNDNAAFEMSQVFFESKKRLLWFLLKHTSIVNENTTPTIDFRPNGYRVTSILAAIFSATRNYIQFIAGSQYIAVVFLTIFLLSWIHGNQEMGKIPRDLRETIAKNIRACRMKKFPGRGGGKKCAGAFGVSPQQWSPWERGMRTPDEFRLSQIAKFFEVTVEYLRRDNSAPPVEHPHGGESTGFGNLYGNDYSLSPPALREPDAPPYGLPSLRRDDNLISGNNVADLAACAARLMGLVGATTKGAAEGRFDIGNTITVLRRLGDILERKLREVENQSSGMPPHF